MLATVHQEKSITEYTTEYGTKTNEQIIKLWLHGKSKNTQVTYSRVISKLLKYITKPLQWITLDDLQEYMDRLEDEGLKTSTRKTYLSAVKSLLSFAQKTGLIQLNVGAAVKAPKSKDCLSQKILAEDVVKSMIADESNTRNVLILKVLYYAGLRVSELTGLTWQDLQGDRLTVFGKGSKTRVVRLMPALATELQNYKPADAGNDEPIFCSRKGKGKGFLAREYVTNLVKKAAKRVGASDSVSAHWLRHAHASHSLDKGCPISLVQATLGHSNVATTSKYLHAKPNESSSLFLG